jgi:hypothetical protein
MPRRGRNSRLLIRQIATIAFEQRVGKRGSLSGKRGRRMDCDAKAYERVTVKSPWFFSIISSGCDLATGNYWFQVFTQQRIAFGGVVLYRRGFGKKSFGRLAEVQVRLRLGIGLRLGNNPRLARILGFEERRAMRRGTTPTSVCICISLDASEFKRRFWAALGISCSRGGRILSRFLRRGGRFQFAGRGLAAEGRPITFSAMSKGRTSRMLMASTATSRISLIGMSAERFCRAR